MENTDRRQFLHSLLKELPYLESVWFQPPETIRLLYPCIVYKWDGNSDRYADDTRYKSKRHYSLTIIDSNPDSVIPGVFEKNFPYATLERTYTSDGLNHWVYGLYF